MFGSTAERSRDITVTVKGSILSWAPVVIGAKFDIQESYKGIQILTNTKAQSEFVIKGAKDTLSDRKIAEVLQGLGYIIVMTVTDKAKS